MAQLAGIEMENFRCFRHLTVKGLSRVNLFVGKNNAGKTALLEAVEALVSEDSPFLFYRASHERGECRPMHNKREEPDAVAVDIRRWFHGHSIEEGAAFSIRAIGSKALMLSRTITNAPTAQALNFVAKHQTIPEAISSSSLATVWVTLERGNSRSRLPPGLPLQSDGFLGAGSPARFMDHGRSLTPPVAFVTTRRLSATDLLAMWSKFVLTPVEREVVAALRTLDERVARVAITGSNGDANAQVLFEGATEPVPLGSLGEGATRMLTIALSLATARSGFFLIDEIETGLHYTAHKALWRLVVETARRLDVQVFATTHSKDCLEAIARLREEDPILADEITVHRLEAGATEAVRMTAATIATNVEGHVDVR